MNKTSAAGIDFQLFDNGMATATLTPVDDKDIDTTLPAGTSVPVWTSSDPGVLVSGAVDGLTAIVTPASPPVLVQDAVLTVTATLPNGTVITGTSDKIDVVGGGVAGFRVALK
jgi:hypothetical protein